MTKLTRFLSVILTLALAISSFILPAHAASGDYNFYGDGNGTTAYVVTRDQAPLRFDKHDEGKVLCRLTAGQVVYCSGTTRNWKGSLWLEIACFQNGKPITAYLYSGNAETLRLPRYTGGSGSLVTICKSLKIDSSFGYRARLSVANGVCNSTSEYKGTSEQNTRLCNIAKSTGLQRVGLPTLIYDNAPSANGNTSGTTITYFAACASHHYSIVDALRSIGAESTSYAYRKTVAALNGMPNYSGTASENSTLLNLLKANRLIKSISTTSSSSSGPETGNISLSLPYFNQADSRWSGTYIYSDTIKNVGCLVTACAMVYSYDSGTNTTPDKMVRKLSFDGNCLIWSSYTNLGYSRQSIYGSLTQDLMRTIYEQLKQGNPVIIGSNGSWGEHWVVITGYHGSTTNFSASGFSINDPGWTNRTNLQQHLDGGYGNQILQIIY